LTAGWIYEFHTFVKLIHFNLTGLTGIMERNYHTRYPHHSKTCSLTIFSALWISTPRFTMAKMLLARPAIDSHAVAIDDHW
jgi:hypothetical protein